MSYLDKNLLPDEHIQFRTKKHIIIFFYPVILTILSGYVTPYMLDNPILTKVVFAPWIVAFLLWSYCWLEYATSEFAVTNKRVMMREGFFTRHSNEMRLAAISQVNVDQSLLGQIMNYGVVSINAFGAYDSFSLIAKPYRFQQSVNIQTDRVSR